MAQRSFRSAIRDEILKNLVRERERPAKVISNEEFMKMVQKKAYELYEKRGRQDGHSDEDWRTAEKIVKEELFK